MNKLVSKNPVLRFKSNFTVTMLKTGGNIPKFKKPSGPLRPQPYKVTTIWGANGNPYDLTGLFFKNLAYEATEPARLIERSTKKAAKKNSKITELQLGLWNSGAFKGVIDKKTGKLVTYERAVDGLMGRMTRLAMENNKKRREAIPLSPRKLKKENNSNLQKSTKIITSSGPLAPSQVIALAASSVKPYVEETADFLAHNPALLLAEDIDRATSNRFIQTLAGIRPFKGRTITSLPTLQLLELINQVKFAKSQKSNLFNSDMYRKMYNYRYASKDGQNEEDRTGVWARMNSPRARLEHTLGLYSFYTDLNGNTIVIDTYDFNDNQAQHGEGLYVDTRNIAGTYGSHSSEPNEGKIKYKINLGKL